MGREFEPHRGHKRNRQKSIPFFFANLYSTRSAKRCSFAPSVIYSSKLPSAAHSITSHLTHSPSLLSKLHNTRSAAPAASHLRSRTQVRSRRLRLTAATSRALFNFEKALLSSNAVLSNFHQAPSPKTEYCV